MKRSGVADRREDRTNTASAPQSPLESCCKENSHRKVLSLGVRSYLLMKGKDEFFLFVWQMFDNFFDYGKGLGSS